MLRELSLVEYNTYIVTEMGKGHRRPQRAKFILLTKLSVGLGLNREGDLAQLRGEGRGF